MNFLQFSYGWKTKFEMKKNNFWFYFTFSIRQFLLIFSPHFLSSHCLPIHKNSWKAFVFFRNSSHSSILFVLELNNKSIIQIMNKQKKLKFHTSTPVHAVLLISLNELNCFLIAPLKGYKKLICVQIPREDQCVKYRGEWMPLLRKIEVTFSSLPTSSLCDF